MKSLLIKSITLATTLGVGATIATWNGGAIIDSTMSKLTTLTSQLSLFKDNEGKLVNKIGEYKAEIERLQALIDSGASEGEINELKAEITRLEGLLEEAQTQHQKDIEQANKQIEDANAKANELQTKLDEFNTSTSTFVPLSQEELASILEGTTTPTPPPSNEITWNLQGTYQDDNVTMVNDGTNITITNRNHQGTTQPIRVKYFNGDTTTTPLWNRIIMVDTPQMVKYSDVSSTTQIQLLDGDGNEINIIIVK